MQCQESSRCGTAVCLEAAVDPPWHLVPVLPINRLNCRMLSHAACLRTTASGTGQTEPTDHGYYAPGTELEANLAWFCVKQ